MINISSQYKSQKQNFLPLLHKITSLKADKYVLTWLVHYVSAVMHHVYDSPSLCLFLKGREIFTFTDKQQHWQKCKHVLSKGNHGLVQILT